MIYVTKSVETWEDCKPVMLEFLKTDCDFLFIPESKSIAPEQFHVSSLKLPNVDLIQFATLKPLQRGELGIREIHWKISEFITGGNAISQLLQFLFKFAPIPKIAGRYKSMRHRRSVIRELSKDVAQFGLVIPHYIEPRDSTVFLSRYFVQALLEFNSKDQLSLFRAIFALARTANFDSLRISDF
jgi:hypothetical protein